MKLDINKIPVLFSKLKDIVKPYLGFMLILIIMLMYGLVIWQIRFYVTQEPSEIKVAQELTTINIPKVDEEAINRITQLEDRNIQVKALFENARQNPFNE
jgi:cell division protein FtsN